MSLYIIKQPNGKYGVFSTQTNRFCLINQTPDQLVESMTSQELSEKQAEIKNIIKQIEQGKNPYFHFAKSFSDVLGRMQWCWGQQSVDDLLKCFEEDDELENNKLEQQSTTNDALEQEEYISHLVANRIAECALLEEIDAEALAEEVRKMILNFYKSKGNN